MPKKVYIVFLHALLAASAIDFNTVSATQISARIIGGSRSNTTAWPWMSGLAYKNSSISDGLFCGASLIAKDWILTAAHCLRGEDKNSFDVIINQAQLDRDDGERISIERFILHPEFNGFTLKNDLALIKLSSPSNNRPIRVLFPYSTQDKPGKTATALGWGTTTATKPLRYPLDLMQVDVPLISNPLCAISMGDITDDMLCAGDGQGQKDTCTGDSGGPLIIFDTESQSWRQVGITSWGFDCAVTDEYGVYTRLKNYARFISDHICTAPETPPSTSLKLSIDGNIASAEWNTVNKASGYLLNYAPYPEADIIYSIDMQQASHFSARLAKGSAYYVDIPSYNDNSISYFSNIEHFIFT